MAADGDGEILVVGKASVDGVARVLCFGNQKRRVHGQNTFVRSRTAEGVSTAMSTALRSFTVRAVSSMLRQIPEGSEKRPWLTTVNYEFEQTVSNIGPDRRNSPLTTSPSSREASDQ
jgi:aconitase B